MTLPKMFERYGRGSQTRILLVAAVGGLLSAAIVAMVNVSLATEGSAASWTSGLLFLAGLGVMFVCNRWSSRKVIQSFEDVQRALRTELAEGVRAAPLRTVEELGARTGQVMGDLAFISNCVAPLVSGVQYSAFLAGMTLVIATVSLKALVIWLVTCAAMARWLLPAMRRLKESRGSISACGGALQASIEELLDGFKQVKLDDRAGDALVEDIKALSTKLCTAQSRAEVQTSKTSRVSLMLFFILGMGVVVFGPEESIGFGPVLGYQMMALLALSLGPLFGVLQALPVISKVEASAATVIDLLDRLREHRSDSPDQGRASFNAIDLLGLAFAYDSHRDGAEPGFVVGPIDMSLRRGQLTLVTGGNGSGKTTMMKMLLGLYASDSGRIRWDGRLLRSDDIPRYRGLFTAIFTGQHLFDRLYGLDVPSERVEALLERFGIADVVGFDGTRFGHLDLSSGQRMRLAMVVALLEDRPICVFDEWTANQDPETTWFYYDTLLPELIAAGKTVIAVSHDDRFFGRADHLVRLEQGKMVHERSLGNPAEPSESESHPE